MIDLVEKDATVYNFAYINPDESFIEYIYVDSHRALRGVRLVKVGEKDYVLLTISSLATTDSLFADRIRVAYFWLVVVLAVVLFMVFRHVRLIDYGYLYQRSQEVNRTKDLFTNMIAHELRAPLTAIRGYASLVIENETVNSEVKEQVRRMQESAERLLMIVNDLLDVARIQSGRLSVTKKPLDVSGVVKQVCQEIGSISAEKKIPLFSV